MKCGSNPFHGTVNGEAEAANAFDAFNLAEGDAKQRAKQIAANFVATLKCPKECRTKTYDPDSLECKIMRVFGEPSPRRRNFFRFVVSARYNFRVICEAPPQPRKPKPAPKPVRPAKPQKPGGKKAEEGKEVQPPPRAEPDCKDPKPAVIYKAGTKFVPMKSFKLPLGTDVTSLPEYFEWAGSAPEKALAKMLAKVKCDEGCEAYWDPDPDYVPDHKDRGRAMDCSFKLLNTIRGRCRPKED